MKILVSILFLILACFEAFAQPANDNCSGAATLTVNTSCSYTSGSTTNATASSGVPAPCAGTADDDVWYTFTANNTRQKITVACNSGFDPVVQIFTGSCGSLVSAYCQDDGGNGVSEVLDLTGFGIGSTYYIRVFDYYTGSGTGSFQICVEGTPPSSNDDPCSATQLPEVNSACVYGIYNLSSSTLTTTPSVPGSCSFDGTGSGKDMWFKVTVPPNGKLDISTYPISGGCTNPTMAVYSGSSCGSLTYITCNDDNPINYMPYISLSGRTPGETIWIRVAKRASTGIGDGRFKLCVSTPSNDDCGSSLFLCDVNGFSGSTLYSYTVDMPSLAGNVGGVFGDGGVTLENNSWMAFTANASTVNLTLTVSDCWVGGSSGIQIQILEGTCGVPSSFGPRSTFLRTSTSGTITATGLIPGRTYYIMVDGYAGDVCNYTISGSTGVKSLSVTPEAANVCNGSSLTLTANPVGFGNPTYSWYSDPPGFSGNTAQVTVNPVEYTKYYVKVKGSCNEVQEASSTITVPNANKQFVWTGAGSTGADNWNDPANWGSFSGCLPDCDNSVVIPTTPSGNPTNFPKLNSAGACKDLIMLEDGDLSDANYSLTINNSGSLTVCGNIYQYGTFPPASHYTSNPSASITLSGSSPQFYLRGANGTNPLPSITLNNSNGFTILEGKETSGSYKNLTINANGTLTFVNGRINTQGARKLVMSNTSTSAITGYNSSRYINGILNRSVNSTGNYVFPVGNKDGYQEMSVNLTASSGLTSLEAFFEQAWDITSLSFTPNLLEPTDINTEYNGYLNNGGPSAGTGNSKPGVWTVIPNAGYTSANYDVTLKGTNYDNASTHSHTVGKRNTPTSCTLTWTVTGTSPSSSNSGGVVTASRNGMSGFSQFVILKGLSVLPVSLVDFYGKCKDGKIIFKWKTASEINNDYFLLYKVFNSGNDTLLIGKIKGSGTSTSFNLYSFEYDGEDKPGDYYYLSQVDFDGTTYHYDPINVNCSTDIEDKYLLILNPNPAEKNTQLAITWPKSETLKVNLTDATGRLAKSLNVDLTDGDLIYQLNLEGLNPGLYYVNCVGDTHTLTQKLIIK